MPYSKRVQFFKSMREKKSLIALISWNIWCFTYKREFGMKFSKSGIPWFHLAKILPCNETCENPQRWKSECLKHGVPRGIGGGDWPPEWSRAKAVQSHHGSAHGEEGQGPLHSLGYQEKQTGQHMTAKHHPSQHDPSWSPAHRQTGVSGRLGLLLQGGKMGWRGHCPAKSGSLWKGEKGELPQLLILAHCTWFSYRAIT